MFGGSAAVLLLLALLLGGAGKGGGGLSFGPQLLALGDVARLAETLFLFEAETFFLARLFGRRLRLAQQALALGGFFRGAPLL